MLGVMFLCKPSGVIGFDGEGGRISGSKQRALLKDVFRGLFLVPFHGTRLRESRLVRMIFSSRELGFARKDSGSPELDKSYRL
jgi:hypothetical protein